MKVTVNGQTVEVPDGSSISVSNGTVTINGAGPGIALGGSLLVVVEGNAGDVRADRGSVEVRGSVGGRVDAGGSVACGAVAGDVRAGGSATCDAVTGSVVAGGSVTCGDVGGRVMAGGSVRRR